MFLLLPRQFHMVFAGNPIAAVRLAATDEIDQEIEY